MEVVVRLATTGHIVYSTKYSAVNELRVWELRLHMCQKCLSNKYFSWTLFHVHDLVEDTALVSAYRDDSSEVTVQFQAVILELRPPTDAERHAIIEYIELRHRRDLWEIMSRGVQMTSTIPAGTARESTLVRAITTRPFPRYDVGPLPDIVTILLLAMCDPNNQGAPPRSTLEVAIRREEAHVVELLLQHQANPHLREQDKNCRS